MTEVTVKSPEPEGEDPSVLAEAAVLSAAVAGASAAKADAAQQDAESAEASADVAQFTANAALNESASKIDEERARAIVREELLALAASAPANEGETETPASDESVAPEMLPPSVEKANQGGTERSWTKRLANKWNGTDD